MLTKLQKILAVIAITSLIATTPFYFFTGTARAAVGFVQGKSNSNNTNTVTATLASTPTSGDLLFVFIAINGSDTMSTPAGWTLDPNYPFTSSFSGKAYVFYKISAGTETTFSQTKSSTSWFSIAYVEYSGIDTSSPRVTSARQESVPGTSSPTTGVAASAGDLSIGTWTTSSGTQTKGNVGGAAATGRTLSPASGFTYGTNFGDVGALEDNTNSSAGTTAATFGTSLNGIYSVFIFKAATGGGGGGGSTPQIPQLPSLWISMKHEDAFTV